MKLLIKSAKIVDSQSLHNNKTVDIFIDNGVIAKISNKITDKADQVIEIDNLHVSPGWIDIGATCWEPGHEHREDMHSLKTAAANGGYTRVYIWPNTDPVIDSKAQYQYFINANHNTAVALLPICSLTKKSQGKELAEIIDLHTAGATLFSDGLGFKGNDKELHKTLEYLKPLDAKMVFAPDAFRLFPEGQIHESTSSITMGLPGLPGLSEQMDMDRLVQIATYSDNTCVAHNITLASSLKTCASRSIDSVGVSYLNLIKSVEACEGFDTNYKLNPPLREKSDVKALLKGVTSSKIDYITSNHIPLENDLKDKEFGLADFGSSGIETVFAALSSDTDIDIATVVECLSYGPAKAAGLTLQPVAKKSIANLTLFDPSKEWIYSNGAAKSKSRNNPFLDRALIGKALGVVANGKVVLN